MKHTICQRLQALISADLEQASHLPEELRLHGEACAACQVELRSATRLLGMLEEVASDLEPKATFAEVAQRAMQAESGQATSAPVGAYRRLWLWIPATALAAAAATLLVVFGLGRLGGGSGSGTSRVSSGTDHGATLTATACERYVAGQAAPEACQTGDTFAAGPSERLRVQLREGTTLWVNHGTRVRLVADQRRALDLQTGQIFLDVTRHGSLPPLVVHLPTGQVDVVGTQVQMLARRDLAVVDVLRGKVVARSGGKSEEVEAGREAILRNDAEPLVRAAADLGVATEWADSTLKVSQGTSGFGSLSARRPGQDEDSELTLRLTDHRVTTRIQGQVARTEIEEAFHNDTNHTLEGIYKFPLPPEARIASLDLLVDGKWEHGAVVERKRGDKIWAGVIRQATPKKRRPIQQVEYIWVPGPWHDPALLKWKQGSQFELRIFPIPAKGERRVRIAYTETLQPIPGGRRYVLPLAASPSDGPQADRFGLDVRIAGIPKDLAVRTAPYDVRATEEGGQVALRMEATSFAPKGDLVIDVPEDELGRELRAFAYKDPSTPDDGYALLSLRPDIPEVRGQGDLQVLFLVDRSYSTQKVRLERAASLVGRVTRALGPSSQVQVLACGTICEPLQPGFSPAQESTASRLEDRVRKLEPLGSTRLRHAMDEAGRALASSGASAATSRVIYVGDGVPTVGETEPSLLASAARGSLRGARLTTVSMGGQVDEVVLRALAGAGDGAYISHGPATPERATALRVLQRQLGEPLRDAKVSLPQGLRDVAPAKLGVIWPGDERLVLGRLGSDVAGVITLTGTLHGQPFERKYQVALKPRPHAGNAFLPRLWAERRIDDLQREGGETRREEIVSLSRHHHVLSRHTSLLVLESPAMAKAFGVEDTRPKVEWTGEEAAHKDESADLSPPTAKKSAAQPSVSMRPMRRADSDMSGAHDLGGGGGSSVAAERQPPMDARLGRRLPRGRGPMMRVAVRKVWYREAALTRHRGELVSDKMELERRKERLDAKPASRERTRDLVRWHIRLGDLDAAERLARHWLEKDRLDAGALVELAGMAALRGDSRLSQEFLASAVDVDPGSAEAHSRLVELYRASGQTDIQCDHALTRGLLDPPNWEHRVTAVRCTSQRERFLDGLDKASRNRAESALASPEKSPSLWERLILEASWDAPHDADVVVVSPRGRVLSWQGGARRTRTEDVHGLRRETLAISMEELGRYQIYLVPRASSQGASSQGPSSQGASSQGAPHLGTSSQGASHQGTAGPALQGQVRIRSYGKMRSFPFATTGKPVPVAELNLVAKWRHERI